MSIFQSVITTTTGAIAFYLGMGVLILAAGWAADTVLGTGNKNP